MSVLEPAYAGLRQWLLQLHDRFGWRLLLTIFIVHHMLKGFVGGGGGSGLIGSGMEFTYRQYGVTGPEMQVYMSVAMMPWTIKAAMGVMSDGFPFFGFQKSSYLALFAGLGGAALLGLGLGLRRNVAVSEGDGSTGPLTGELFVPLPILTCALSCAFFQMALSDLLVEAKYSESVKAMPESGPDLITFVWGGIQFASLGSTVVSGWLIDAVGPWACFLASAPIAALVAWPALRNYLQETRLENSVGCRPEMTRWKGDGRVPFFLAIVMGVAGVLLAFVSVVVESLRTKFAVAVAVGALNLTLFSVFFRPAIARMNAFFFLQNCFHVGTHGASFYFFTDTVEQFPEGPHFSARFFVTTIGSVASFFSLVGMLCYNRFAKGWKYRSIFAISSLAFMVVNCLSAVVFLRWNLRWRIPDSVFMLASGAMQSVIGQIGYMPCTVMLSQLCPDGLESTMYAMLAGSLNFGMTVANYAGAYLLECLDVRPKGEEHESAQFNNLWLAALVSACGPCVPLLLLPVLIPDVGQTDRLLAEGDNPSSATAGSLFERWQGSWRSVAYGTLDEKSAVGPSSDEPPCTVIGLN